MHLIGAKVSVLNGFAVFNADIFCHEWFSIMMYPQMSTTHIEKFQNELHDVIQYYYFHWEMESFISMRDKL